MINSTAALSRIEDAERETPFCECGLPMVPVERLGVIWLTCRSLDHSGGRLRRLLTLDFGHVARPIVDLAELETIV
jgi:hypothetical protein